LQRQSEIGDIVGQHVRCVGHRDGAGVRSGHVHTPTPNTEIIASAGNCVSKQGRAQARPAGDCDRADARRLRGGCDRANARRQRRQPTRVLQGAKLMQFKVLLQTVNMGLPRFAHGENLRPGQKTSPQIRTGIGRLFIIL